MFSVVVLTCAAGFSWGADVSMHALGRKSGLADTGQTKCYNDSNVSGTCPNGTFGQDGDYTSTASSPSFTLNGTAPNQTTTDNRTGLMWVSNPADALMISSYSWVSSTGAVAACQNLTFAGYSDWRLPNIKELMSLVDYGISAAYPQINAAYFPGTLNAYTFWSSTTYGITAGERAWTVAFTGGYQGYNYKASSIYYVRCVRGGV